VVSARINPAPECCEDRSLCRDHRHALTRPAATAALGLASAGGLHGPSAALIRASSAAPAPASAKRRTCCCCSRVGDMQWRGQLDRHAVGQPGDSPTQRQVGIQPGRAPALGVALRLPDVGRAHFLHVPHLLAFHPQPDPGTIIRGDACCLPAVVSERPALTGLDPARWAWC